MTIIEQIKAEIERRVKELDEQIVDIYDSKAVLRKNELQRLLSFLSTLESEKPVPNDLEEAAKRIVVSLIPTFGQKYEDGSYVKGIRDYFSLDELIGIVKAGAEWMAEQGVSMEYEVEDKCLELGYGSLPGLDPIINLPDSFKPGDKVIVQIRKKY